MPILGACWLVDLVRSTKNAFCFCKTINWPKGRKLKTLQFYPLPNTTDNPCTIVNVGTTLINICNQILCFSTYCQSKKWMAYFFKAATQIKWFVLHSLIEKESFTFQIARYTRYYIAYIHDVVFSTGCVKPISYKLKVHGSWGLLNKVRTIARLR